MVSFDSPRRFAVSRRLIDLSFGVIPVEFDVEMIDFEAPEGWDDVLIDCDGCDGCDTSPDPGMVLGLLPSFEGLQGKSKVNWDGRVNSKLQLIVSR
jgi:hypothetical protein